MPCEREEMILESKWRAGNRQYAAVQCYHLRGVTEEMAASIKRQQSEIEIIALSPLKLSNAAKNRRRW